MMERRRTILLALALVALLAPTRFSGLTRDLPYNLDVDAPCFVDPALRLAARGTLDSFPPTNPGTTLIGPLALTYALEHAWGRLTGRWSSGADFEAAVAANPRWTLVPARAFCGLVGLAVIPATALVALELGLSPPAGLLAATLVGLSGVHWQLAHLVRTDLLLTLFLLLTVALSVRALDGDRRSAALAGAAAGLATASKWPGALTAVAPLAALACTAPPGASAARRRATAAALVVAGLALGAYAWRWEYTWKPLPGFEQVPPDFRDGHVFLRRLVLQLSAGLVATGLGVAASGALAARAVAVLFDPRTHAAAGAAVVAFVLAGPYLLADGDRVVQGLVYEARSDTISMHGDPGLGNLWRYLSGPLVEDLGIAGVLAGFAGLGVLLAANRRRGAIVVAVAAAYLAFFSMGKVFTPRYVAPLIPLLAIGAATLVERLADGGARARAAGAALVALVLVVPALRIGELERRLTLRNTRIQATEWFRSTVPVGRSAAVEEHSVILCAHCYPLQTLGGLWRLKNRPDLVVTSSWVHGYFMKNAARFPEAAAAYARVLADYVEIASFWPDGESADGPEIRVYRRKR